jgi:flavin reductase (DIM6/NTAB) family NADH-FMN oxidoreductase RutF
MEDRVALLKDENLRLSNDLEESRKAAPRAARPPSSHRVTHLERIVASLRADNEQIKAELERVLAEAERLRQEGADEDRPRPQEPPPPTWEPLRALLRRVPNSVGVVTGPPPLPSPHPPPAAVDETDEAGRRALARGVERLRAATVSTFQCVSAAPTVVSISIQRRSRIAATLRACANFSVMLADADAAPIAARFGATGASTDDLLAETPHRLWRGLLPILGGGVGAVVCRPYPKRAHVVVGDHLIFFGEVVAVFENSDTPSDSLVYANRAYVRLPSAPPADDGAAVAAEALPSQMAPAEVAAPAPAPGPPVSDPPATRSREVARDRERGGGGVREREETPMRSNLSAPPQPPHPAAEEPKVPIFDRVERQIGGGAGALRSERSPERGAGDERRHSLSQPVFAAPVRFGRRERESLSVATVSFPFDVGVRGGGLSIGAGTLGGVGRSNLQPHVYDISAALVGEIERARGQKPVVKGRRGGGNFLGGGLMYGGYEVTAM